MRPLDMIVEFSFVNLVRTFRACVVLLAALMCLPWAAHAQDGSPTYPANVNWSGFYVGGHVGYAAVGQDSVFDSSTIDSPLELDDATLGRDMDLEGVLGGLNIGWNTMTGSIVWGLEADVSYLGASDRASDPESEGTNGSTTDNASLDVKWLASLRGRIGIASARSLFFATAGIAWVDAKYTAQNLDNSSSDQGSVSLSGPGIVVGGGVEHAISNRISVKLEGLYYRFDRLKDTNSLTTDSGPSDFAEVKDIIVARLGVSYSLAPKSNWVATPDQSSEIARWQGFYVGANAGYGLVDFDSIFDAGDILDPVDNEYSVFGRFLDLDSGVFGGHIGYNVMFGRYVVGIETDWNSLRTSDLRFDPDNETPVTDHDYASAEINWMASLRARLGITSDRTLFYATGGLAWVNADYNVFDVGCGCTTASRSISLNQQGFVFGGGLEHALTDQILLRFEALHYVFGDSIDTRSLSSDSDPGDFAKLKDISAARIGVSYKFNSN